MFECGDATLQLRQTSAGECGMWLDAMCGSLVGAALCRVCWWWAQVSVRLQSCPTPGVAVVVGQWWSQHEAFQMCVHAVGSAPSAEVQIGTLCDSVRRWTVYSVRGPCAGCKTVRVCPD